MSTTTMQVIELLHVTSNNIMLSDVSKELGQGQGHVNWSQGQGQGYKLQH